MLCAQYKYFWNISVTKLDSSLVVSIKSFLCETPLKKPQTLLPAQLNLVPFLLLCGGKLFSSQMLKLEMLMEKSCFSNYTYSTLLWASCNICLKVLVFPDVGYLSYVCAAGRQIGTVGASYKIHGSFILFWGTKLGCRKYVYVWGIYLYKKTQDVCDCVIQMFTYVLRKAKVLKTYMKNFAKDNLRL